MTTQIKQPALHRESIIKDLIIQDLIDMDKTGNYDRQVLLWMQDGFVDRAIQENISYLRDLHIELLQSGEDDDQIRRRKNQELVNLTRATYSTAKGGGGGVDLKGYIDAAQVFFESEAARFGGHLQEVAEYIQKALANGEQPDVERFGKQVYWSLKAMSVVSAQLEGLQGKVAAQQVGLMMKRGIEDISYVVVSKQSTSVGREILKMVDVIGRSPEKYFGFNDPANVVMPPREPWDFVPIEKQEINDYLT